MSTLRKKLIRLAHSNPELRQHLLPLLRQADGTPEWAKGKTFTHPKTRNKVQWSSLPADEQAKLRKKNDGGDKKDDDKKKPKVTLSDSTKKLRDKLGPLGKKEFEKTLKAVETAESEDDAEDKIYDALKYFHDLSGKGISLGYSGWMDKANGGKKGLRDLDDALRSLLEDF